MRIIFCRPNTTHNYIISHLDYNIMERLDRRLVKYIYNLLHTNNSTVQSIVKVNYVSSEITCIHVIFI